MRDLLKTMYVPDTKTVAKTAAMVGVSMIVITGLIFGVDTLITLAYQSILNMI